MPDRNFDIDLDYKPLTGFASAFEEAAERWEDVIVADLQNVQEVDDLLIKVRVIPIDGERGTLGQAGPTRFRKEGGLPYMGVMEFDVADVASIAAGGTLPSVVMHEMAHVLGLERLWSRRKFDLIDFDKSGYTGENALAEYRTLTGNPAASVVPLETTGGRGTVYSHWAEAIFGDELMTGYADDDLPLSRVTVGALEDLGYTVRYAAADPFAL